jgi:hypothetical protein
VDCFIVLGTRRFFVRTNAKFLEDDYVNNFKSKISVVLEEMLHAKAGKSLKMSKDEIVY